MNKVLQLYHSTCIAIADFLSAWYCKPLLWTLPHLAVTKKPEFRPYIAGMCALFIVNDV